MAYALWIREIDRRQGCKYTISCGEKLIELHSPENDDDLKNEVIEILEDHGFPEEEFLEIVLLKIEQRYDVDALADALSDSDDEEDEEDDEKEARRLQYEELKREFG